MMGGGDLNLKKSWHPHTMKNQEKVWRAEQAKNAEEKKLNELRKEITEERNREELTRIGKEGGVLTSTDDKKLEWMYKGEKELINRNEYLLGRSVDKSFEKLEADEKSKAKDLVGLKIPVNHVEHECVPFSIRTYRNFDSTEQVDLQRKIMEDPLMLIKQKELESRRKILENPVKLKELHRILKSQQSVTKSKKIKKDKKKKSSKKSKKKRKRRTSSSSYSDSHNEVQAGESNLDALLERQYKKLKNDDKLAGLSLTKLLDAKYETISKELDKTAESRKNKIRTQEKCSRRSSSTDNCKSRKYKYRDSSRPRQIYESGRNKRQRSRSRSNLRNETSLGNKHTHTHGRKEFGTSDLKAQLTDEEKQRRCREMMQNAAWRDEERIKTVQKHREEYTKEENEFKTKAFDKGFLNKQLKNAISNQTSVGSRIRSNMNNIQRRSDSMFTQK